MCSSRVSFQVSGASPSELIRARFEALQNGQLQHLSLGKLRQLRASGVPGLLTCKAFYCTDFNQITFATSGSALHSPSEECFL